VEMEGLLRVIGKRSRGSGVGGRFVSVYPLKPFHQLKLGAR
jgi:hypothetical protein